MPDKNIYPSKKRLVSTNTKLIFQFHLLKTLLFLNLELNKLFKFKHLKENILVKLTKPGQHLFPSVS